MGIFETYYAKKVALTESAKVAMDESAVLIEYIQDLEEKLKAYVTGDDGYKSRTPDEHKNEPAASAERKQAADKIRAARKSTGLHGSKIDRGDIAVTGANKSPSNTKNH